jgi:hypothetical protein
MGILGGFALPFGPPPTTTTSPLASLGLAKPSRDGPPPAKPAGSPREFILDGRGAEAHDHQ